ncbi:OmpA family protein [Bdellovibrio sp. HCB185ZH]|uniref:OmpA family protein n=1 Tax=Bdellovibrio sp. HCB185ZH TaxID=3394235 RepID=UPI0039A5052F
MKAKRKQPQENFVWISYSDLSTTLMLCFILIFLVTLYERDKNASQAEKYLLQAQTVTREVYDARSSYIESLKEIVKAMQANKTRNGCEDVDWKVDEQGNAIQMFFKTSGGWFADGSSTISPMGRKCLNSFAYSWLLGLYAKSEHRDRIDRLVIEGHTNSKPPTDKREDPYLYNLKLSQARAYEAANFIFQNLQNQPDMQSRISKFSWNEFVTWRNHVLTATGRGSAEPILLAQGGQEDFEKSKRIEFKFTIKHNYEGYKTILGEHQ